MASDLAFALEFTLAREGGFVDDPHDPGGATNHGVSLRWLRTQPDEAADIDGDGDVDADDIRVLTRAQAAELYTSKFWTGVRLPLLPVPALRVAAFDFAVNCGPRAAVKALQQVTTQCGEPCAVDGDLGPATAAAVGKCAALLPEEQLFLTRYHLARLAYYHHITGKNPALARYLRGWMGRVFALEEVLRRP